MKRRIVWAATTLAGVVLTASPALAQEPATGPGWTFVPSFVLTETYDDNITLFGRGTAEAQNDDTITSYTPQAELTYRGRRTRVGSSYSGSLLSYRTHSMFNRWDQAAQASVRRSETMRLEWSGTASLTMRPSTDALDFDGIPFSHTGVTVRTGRGSVNYRVSGRDALSTSFTMQKVDFERPDELLPYLRGGQASESFTTYRRRVNGRLAVGANYSLRRAAAIGETENLHFHMSRAAADFDLSPRWTINAAGGLDYVMASSQSPAQSAPGFSVSAAHGDGLRRFQVGYQRMFLPSFGFGGAIGSQELGVSYHTPIFGSRHFYTDHVAMLRDSRPLVEAPGRLRLRSLRTSSSLGWQPRPWVRVEGFYSRTQQTSLIPGGAVDRNRLGFLIITSTPVRVQ